MKTRSAVYGFFLFILSELAFAADKQPTELDLLMNSAQTAARQGEFDQAKSVFENILEQNAKHLGALNGLADICLRLGEKTKAVTLYRNAVELDFRDPHARVQLARIYRSDNLLNEAIRLLEQVLLYNPMEMETALDLAKLQSEAGRVEDSLQTLLNAVRATKDCDACDRILRADLYFALAMIEQEASAWKTHAQYILSTLENNPLHKDALLQAIRIAIEERRYEDAKAHFRVILVESPVVRPNVQILLNLLPFPAGPAILIPECYASGEKDYGDQLVEASIVQAKGQQRQDWVVRFEKLKQNRENK